LELRAYQNQRHVGFWLRAAGRKIATWWQFYCGTVLSVPLFLPPLLRKGNVRIGQSVVLVGLLTLVLIPSDYPNAWRFVVDILAPIEIWVLWSAFNDKWSRLAIATCTFVMSVLLFAKWAFPHYFAPCACLVLYLQVAGLKRLWEWDPRAEASAQTLSRSERRRKAREGKNEFNPAPWVKSVVYIVPAACFLSLILRIEGRINGWKEDPHGPDRQALLMDDWSLRRAEMEKWLEDQPEPQLVFIRYSPRHNVNFEWVYNHPDIMRSRVIWARDLGAEHNKLLLDLLKDRTVWLIEADQHHPQLVPYEGVTGRPLAPPDEPRDPASSPEQSE
jgi:hypothetical protein